jgi:hypothetical protein
MRQAAVAVAVLCAFAARPAPALDAEWLSASARLRVDDKRVIGKKQPQSFKEYDLMLTRRLPWEARSSAGWGLDARLLVSAGVMQGGSKTALVASLIPVLAFGTRDGALSLDGGLGLAVLSEHRYEQQDYGGPVQFALTVGLVLPLYQKLGAGYRFVHYSDGGLYGTDTIGADFHMAEVTWRF